MLLWSWYIACWNKLMKKDLEGYWGTKNLKKKYRNFIWIITLKIPAWHVTNAKNSRKATLVSHGKIFPWSKVGIDLFVSTRKLVLILDHFSYFPKRLQLDNIIYRHLFKSVLVCFFLLCTWYLQTFRGVYISSFHQWTGSNINGNMKTEVRTR